MQELRLVAVSEDGTYLVLATAGRGTRFTLPVDDRVRAAVRGHFSRLGQFEIEVESPLRPKEIQARIRSGETAEEIAESAGIPVERVRWFEGPVLQEREYMAQQAQRVAVRRPGESTPGPPLGETVEERLGRGGVDLEDVEWDAWKCDNGTWRVRLSFFDNGRPHAAEWAFDPRRRHVSPLDEIAARLTAVEWDDDEMSDTVTPLVPRRPAMKVVTDGRDIGRGLPAESEPPVERPSEPPLRAAEPREYIVDRGRIVDPRPAFPSTVQPGRPREVTGNRDPIRPFDDTEPSAPSAGPPWRRAPEPTLEELEATPVPPRARPGAEQNRAEEPRRQEPAEAPEPAIADGTAAGEPETPQEQYAEDDYAAEEPTAERPDSVAYAEDGPSARQDWDDTADDIEPAAEDAEQAVRPNPRDEPTARDQDLREQPARERADEQAPRQQTSREPAAREQAPRRPAEREQAPREQADREQAPREPAAREQTPREQTPREQVREPAEREQAQREHTSREPAAREQTPREHTSREPAAREQAPREQTRREQAPREPAAAREEAPRERVREPAAREPDAREEAARPPAKKAPARPAMPAAAQDTPVTGPPAAAAADAASATQRPARARRKSKGKRASVPSWDEIMFGARRPE